MRHRSLMSDLKTKKQEENVLLNRKYRDIEKRSAKRRDSLTYQ